MRPAICWSNSLPHRQQILVAALQPHAWSKRYPLPWTRSPKGLPASSPLANRTPSVETGLTQWGRRAALGDTNGRVFILAARLHGVSSPAGELLRQSCRCSDSAQVGCLKFPIEILQCTNLVRRQQRMVNRQQRWHGLRPRRQAVLAEWSSQDARAQCACQTHKESEQHITAASKSAGFLFAVSAGGRLLVRFATFCMLLPI